MSSSEHTGGTPARRPRFAAVTSTDPDAAPDQGPDQSVEATYIAGSTGVAQPPRAGTADETRMTFIPEGTDPPSNDETFIPAAEQSADRRPGKTAAATNPAVRGAAGTPTPAHGTAVAGSGSQVSGRVPVSRVSVDNNASGSARRPIQQLGDFKLVRKLGQGGMGEVYLAHQISLDRPAALKVLAKHLAGKPDFVTRFVREARSMAKMDHPNAVRVFAVDEDQGLNYVAMEFVDGKSVQYWVEKLHRLNVGDAVHITLRCAEALAFAHGQNMVHRDIKPDNIMLTSKGAVKVADFGLAKATDDELSMTQSGTGMGTPFYMSPEQARNAKHVDGRTDIYALGVTLYHLLTGKLPFAGNSAMDVIMAKEKGTFTPARRLNGEIPERLDLIIDKMVAKDIEQRFKDCNELIRHLAGLGLESPSLSFIDAPDRVAQTATVASPMSRTATASAAEGAGARAAANAIASAVSGKHSSTGDQWIVQHRNPAGKDVVARFSTEQVLKAMKAGSLDPGARAKKHAADTFLPLAHYPEFSTQVQGKLTRQNADKKSTNIKKVYAQVDRAERWRKFTRRFKGLTSSVAGLISFAIYLAIIAAIGIGLYFAVPFLWDMAAKQMNLQLDQQNQPAQKKAANPEELGL